MLMVFPYMDHDLSGLLDNEQVSWTIPVIKLYAKQLLKGTAFLHQVRVLGNLINLKPWRLIWRTSLLSRRTT